MTLIHIHKATATEFTGWDERDLAGIDQNKSLDALDEQTLAAVQAAVPTMTYPDSYVELVDGDGINSFKVYPKPSGEIASFTENEVEDIVSRVYSAWRWLRNGNNEEVTP